MRKPKFGYEGTKVKSLMLRIEPTIFTNMRIKLCFFFFFKLEA
jgi:hypothetical protein